jgi:hypothetical protein
MVYFSVLKMGALFASEMSVNVNQNTVYHIPEDCNLEIQHFTQMSTVAFVIFLRHRCGKGHLIRKDQG